MSRLRKPSHGAYLAHYTTRLRAALRPLRAGQPNRASRQAPDVETCRRRFAQQVITANNVSLSHRVSAIPTGRESSQVRVPDQRVFCVTIFAAWRLSVRSFSQNPRSEKLASKPNCQIDILRWPAIVERRTARMCSEQCNANQTAELTSVHDSIRGKTPLDAIGICRPNPNAKLAWPPESVIEAARPRPSSESCKTNPTANMAHDLASIREPKRADESRGPPACGRDARPPNSNAQPMAASGLTPPGFLRQKMIQMTFREFGTRSGDLRPGISAATLRVPGDPRRTPRRSRVSETRKAVQLGANSLSSALAASSHLDHCAGIAFAPVRGADS